MGWRILGRITWLPRGTGGGGGGGGWDLFLPTESKGGDLKKLSVNQLPKNTEPHEGMR